MTDVAVPQQDLNDLALWASEARQVHQIAVSLAGTSFVPRAMQGRPDEVTGAILAGRELGLPPMVALRAIDIIDGSVAMRAHALRGIVQSFGHKVWVEESTQTRAVVCGHRKDEPGRIQKSIWTTDRAQKANLLGKKNWASHTQAMLVARATAELCRLIASDAIIGMPYATEELQDGGDPEATPKLSAAPKKIARRVALKEPDLEQPPERTALSPEEQKAEDQITGKTRIQLLATIAGKGIRDRDQRLAFIARHLGRRVESVNELTDQEGMELIARFEAMDELPSAGVPDDPS